jgi:zinc protease
MRAHLRTILPPSIVAVVAAAAPAGAAPLPLSRHLCDNGLEVVVSEMHGAPLVTVEAAVRAGAMVEDDTINGVSHLYEHMFFKGNASQPDLRAYEARKRALGLDWNGSTDDERVDFHVTTTSDHLADQMAFMRDALVTPRFDPQELDRERVAIAGEIDRQESEPAAELSHAIEQRLFSKNPSRRWPGGKRVSVLRATVGTLQTLNQRYVVPNNSILVVTGDVKADVVFAMADSLYAGWAKADDPFKRFPIPDDPALPASEVVLVSQPVEVLTGEMVWLGPSSIGPSARDTYAVDLLMQLVGDPGARFQRALVDSGACVSATLGFQTKRRGGEIEVDFEATPDKADACISAVAGELPRLKAPEYFSEAELHGAARRMEIGRALDSETTLGRAKAISASWAMASLEYDAGYEAAIRAVTRDDVSRVLDRWMLGRPFVLGVMTSLRQIDSGLTEDHVGALVGIAAKRSGKTPAATPNGAGVH